MTQVLWRISLFCHFFSWFINHNYFKVISDVSNVSSPIHIILPYGIFLFSSVQLLSHVRLFVTHELQHARPPCPSPTPGVHPNSSALSKWCHPAISSWVVPFSSLPQSLPASGSFPMSQLFTWGGQSIRVSASALVLPMNTQQRSV